MSVEVSDFNPSIEVFIRIGLSGLEGIIFSNLVGIEFRQDQSMNRHFQVLGTIQALNSV